MSANANIGVVILAAGSSRRLGRSKQLLQFRDKTLLQHMTDMIIPFEFSSSVLVLGAYADKIREATELASVSVVHNEHWSEGIASSIRLGVEASIKQNPSLDSILFLLSDQPYVTSGLIRKIINRHEQGNQRITACRYKQNIGVPAIFGKHFFQQLMELTGDVGAKKIMLRNRDQIDEVAFEKGLYDIDTTRDYEQLQDNGN